MVLWTRSRVSSSGRFAANRASGGPPEPTLLCRWAAPLDDLLRLFFFGVYSVGGCQPNDGLATASKCSVLFFKLTSAQDD